MTWRRCEFVRRVRVLAAPLIVWVLLWAPSVSQACSQCLATRTRENQLAFIWTTVFLSVMPLLVVGGIAFWLRRRLSAANQPLADEVATDARPGISSAAPIH